MAERGRVQVERNRNVVRLVIVYRFNEHICKAVNRVYRLAFHVIQYRKRVKRSVYKTVSVNQNEFFHIILAYARRFNRKTQVFFYYYTIFFANIQSFACKKRRGVL